MKPILLVWILGALGMCCLAQQSPNLTLTEPVTLDAGTTNYQAPNSITSATTFIVEGAGSSTFTAGCSITLQPGFQAIGGSASVTFHAVIGGGSCSSSQPTGSISSQLPPVSKPSKEYIRLNGQVIAIENAH